MTGNGHIMKHHVRMEMLVATGKKTVTIDSILTDLMKLANSEYAAVAFYDAEDNEFDASVMPNKTDFEERFCVTIVQTPKFQKIMLGMYMESTVDLSEIKRIIGLAWLRRHNIFLRPHHLSFHHGTDLYLLGYIVQEHPGFVNLKEMEDLLARKWFDKDDRAKIENSKNPALIKAWKDMVDAKILVHDAVRIPITVERSFLRVTADGHKQFDAYVLNVYVPRKWRDPALLLSDRSVLEKESRPTMIPFSLSKSDPVTFYHQLALHQKFMDHHRNVQLINAPAAHVMTTKEPIHGTAQTLHQLLQQHPQVQRISMFPNEDKVNLSVSAADYSTVTSWLETTLPRFTKYQPLRTYGSGTSLNRGEALSTGSPSQKSSKFSAKFKVAPTALYDPSTAPVRPRRNAWATGPPVTLIFASDPEPDALSEDEFPPLPTLGDQSRTSKSGKSSITETTSPPTATSKTIEQLVKEAVAANTAKMEARINGLEQEFKKLQASIDSIPQQVMEGSLEILSGAASPFVTKEEFFSAQKSTEVALQAHTKALDNVELTLKRILECLPSATGNNSQSSPPRKMQKAREADTSFDMEDVGDS